MTDYLGRKEPPWAGRFRSRAAEEVKDRREQVGESTVRGSGPASGGLDYSSSFFARRPKRTVVDSVPWLAAVESVRCAGPARRSKVGRVGEFKAPSGRTTAKCGSSRSPAAQALSGGEWNSSPAVRLVHTVPIQSSLAVSKGGEYCTLVSKLYRTVGAGSVGVREDLDQVSLRL